MQILGAAYEPYGRHTEAVRVHGFLCGVDEAAVVRQPQVVVGTEVKHLSAILNLDVGALRSGYHTFVLVQSGSLYVCQFLREEFFHFTIHSFMI